ncbi:ABC transporter permease [Crateriforma conspicua]|uniref:ABC-2 family transporter protein n=1 Tax=Crateriforma conspicua TaxID=2527996 RepID=A0A5C5Y515_9PLAN|nr:ABC transporter permease [Crateriforma conspicua]QDV64318.1 ABC-2 family transporter protein [Crateriforma conspicua]TWT69711.1 ABC-2 family transporter protein [Crateriforma conspicua]
MASPALTGPSDSTPPWLRKIDDWCLRIGDWINPILVKETRQALKSRQFLVTFSLLLIAALGWTIVGSMMRMPQIYTTPTASFMLVGYYVVLAVPMLLVVPLAAYRSLEAELDDGTLELLSISTLSPWQIVLGKLASGTLQMTLYFVALLPCFAFAYTLRGIDLPTLLLVMAFLFLCGLLLTTAALTFAPQSRSRNARVVTLLLVLSMLLLGEYVIGAACITMIWFGIPFPTTLIVFAVVSALLLSFAIGNLLVTTTAMMLTPESENRSTRLRLSLLLLTVIAIGLNVFGVQVFAEEGLVLAFPTAIFLTILWLVSGSMMAAESPAMTPRIRRELPETFAGRAVGTFLTPGPAAGLIFGVVGLVSVLVVSLEVLRLYRNQPNSTMPSGFFDQATNFVTMLGAYAVIFLVATRWLVAFVRRFHHVRVEFGIAAFIVVAVFAAVIPYSIGLYLADGRDFRYSTWQISNWAWTLSLDVNQVPVWVPFLLTGTAVIGLLSSLLISSTITLPRKTLVPKRVIDEQQRTSKQPVSAS